VDLLRALDPAHWTAPLAAVGDYLRRMHAITFTHPGYIMPGELDAPPADGSWQHCCWTARQRQRDALTLLK